MASQQREHSLARVRIIRRPFAAWLGFHQTIGGIVVAATQ
jgi:hypothetical protein